jgi:hypothetical protein
MDQGKGDARDITSRFKTRQPVGACDDITSSYVDGSPGLFVTVSEAVVVMVRANRERHSISAKSWRPHTPGIAPLAATSNFRYTASS